MSSDLLWSLIAIQIALGGFDTLYHHEFTERLAWRASQRHELQLHSIRNFIYAALFLVLGWTEVHGGFAIVVIALLAIEIVITLLDFVEEDVSRKLPPSERITHTLLAINYGGVLILLIPALLAWSRMPTAVLPASYGWWSALATASAVAVALFGLRDAIASRRCLRLETRQAGRLVAALAERHTVVVTGASGFIGSRLIEALVASGHEVIAHVRAPNPEAPQMRPITFVSSLDQIDSGRRIDAVVNLAGEPIANALWTDSKRRSVAKSRQDMTTSVLQLIGRLERKPNVLISASAIGWYGLWQDESLDETSPAHHCFSHTLCADWEATARLAEAMGVRVVLLRIGQVLGTQGGMLTRLLTPFEFGLGGRMGNGLQWMSWIDRDDVIRLIAHAIASPDLSGPLNATAPSPVTNEEFTRELGRVLHRPAILPVPAAVLETIAGDLARELMLGGQKVLPRAALASGFVFEQPHLGPALAAMLGATAATSSPSLSRSPTEAR